MQDKQNWDAILENLENLIRTGQSSAALEKLLSITRSRIPDPLRISLSKIARRAGNGFLAIKIMRPRVRQDGRKAMTASQKEITEYAAALIFVGSTNEAQKLLKKVDSDQVPEKLLYEAFAYFSQWNYRAAIPGLRKFIRNRSIDKYQSLVAQVNLSAAELLTNQEDRAWKRLKKIIEPLKKQNAKLLLQNINELQIQYAVLVENWELMDELIKSTSDLNIDKDSIYSFYRKKWFLVSRLKRAPPEELKKILTEFIDFQNQAYSKGFWEVVRDCDYQIHRVTRSEAYHWKLWFGTSYESYRKKIESDFPQFKKAPQEWMWLPKPNAPRTDSIIDLNNLGITGKPYQLLIALFSDLYRPQSIGELFEQLYPGEYFDPKSSLQRIDQLIFRLRKILVYKNISLKIDVQNYEYKIKTDCPVLLRRQQRHPIILQLQSIFSKKKIIKNSDICTVLKISRRSATRLMQQAEEEGYVKKLGSAAHTAYKARRSLYL